MRGVAIGGFDSVAWEEGRMTGFVHLRSVLRALVLHKMYVNI